MSVQIDTTIIFTPRMQELAQFYQEGLGLQAPIPTSDDHLGFPLGAVYLGFDQVAEPWQSPGAVTLWFRVDDLDATFERFTGLGARVNYPPVDTEKCLTFTDPDGNWFQLVNPVDH